MVRRLGWLVGAALGAILAAPVFAQEPEVVLEEGDSPDVQVVSLQALMSKGGALEVRGRGGRLDFSLPTPQHGAVESAFLRLSYMNSAPLAADRSQFLVDFNGQALAELPLTAGKSPVSVEVTLPSNLFLADSNKLRFSIDQQHVNGCDAESLSALWTSVDPLNSYVVLETSGALAPVVLNSIEAPYGAFLAPGAPVAIMTVSEETNEAKVRTGSLVAQGIALRTGGRPTDFLSVAVEPAAAEDVEETHFPGLWGNGVAENAHVLLGTKRELRDVVAPSVLQRINGPFLGLLPLGSVPGKNLLIVSGQTDREVLIAASRFADVSQPLPDTATAVVEPLPQRETERQAFMTAGEQYAFDELAFSKDNLGLGTEPRTTVSFVLPPDFYAKDNRSAELELNYAYTGGLAADSLVNVAVNGKYATSVQLPNDQGDIIHNQSVEVPLRLLKGGRNELSFEPVLSAEAPEACFAVAGTDSRIGIFGDSTIEVPKFARVLRMPELGNLSAAAFPFAMAEFGDSQVVAAAADPATIGAVWTLVAKLAQVAGEPLLDLGYTFDASATTGHALVVGALPDIDRLLLAQAPIDVAAIANLLVKPPTSGTPLVTTEAEQDLGTGDRSLWEQRLAADNWFKADKNVRQAGALDGFRSDLRSQVARLGPLGSIFDDVAEAPLNLSEDQNLDAFAVAYESPFAAERVLTIVTARDANILQRATSELVRPILWEELGGDFSLWSTQPHEMFTTRAGNGFSVASVGPTAFEQKRLMLNSYMAERPFLWLAAVLVALVLFAAVSHMFVVVRQNR